MLLPAPACRHPTRYRGGESTAGPLRSKSNRSLRAAALSTASTTAESTADVPCRAPPDPRNPRGPRSGEEPGPLPPTPRQMGWAFPVRDAFHRRVLTRSVFRAREPATGPAALPPLGRLPALFHRPALSRRPARPTSVVPRPLRPRSLRAARRSSTSATKDDLRARPPRRSNPAHRARGRPRAPRLIAGGSERLSTPLPAEAAEVRGRNRVVRVEAVTEDRRPRIAIAREGGFAPTCTTPGHLVSR